MVRFVIIYWAVEHVHSLLSIARRKCGIYEPEQAFNIHYEGTNIAHICERQSDIGII